MKLRTLIKPEYLYNPGQILRRLRLTDECIRRGECVARLRWGLDLRIDPRELIGNCIARLGVYDLAVSEALWRLVDPGESAIDAGSNIGYTASILARRVGPSGRVYCFEPHPVVYQRLERNVALWQLPVQTFQMALSAESGEAALHIPKYFSGNQGTASLDDRPGSAEYGRVAVHTEALDALRVVAGPIGVMKVDVEGHELSVFAGAERRLSAGEIRDIVFEDHAAPPTAVMRLLERHGYTVLALSCGFFGPRLTPLSEPLPRRRAGEPPNYLATRDPDRAMRRLRPAGWRILARGR